MKENNKQVVFYSAEKDGFLESYKDKGSLVYTAVFTKHLEKALFLPLESYEEQKNELDNLAEAFGCEVLIFERTEREESMEDGIKALIEFLAK